MNHYEAHLAHSNSASCASAARHAAARMLAQDITACPEVTLMHLGALDRALSCKHAFSIVASLAGSPLQNGMVCTLHTAGALSSIHSLKQRATGCLPLLHVDGKTFKLAGPAGRGVVLHQSSLVCRRSSKIPAADITMQISSSMHTQSRCWVCRFSASSGRWIRAAVKDKHRPWSSVEHCTCRTQPVVESRCDGHLSLHPVCPMSNAEPCRM